MYRTPTSYSREGLVMARDYERCFTSMCRHVANDSYYAQPFYLEEFQRENIWKPLFASGKMTARGFKRKYRRAIIGLPSGYGKSETCAGILLTVATMEPVHNGQYGMVASSKDQIRNVYEKICTMIKLNPTWREQWDIGKNIITHKETNAKIMILPNTADALESWHFNFLIFDELHTYPDSKVWDAGVKGQKVLWNPLTVGITTAGDKREGFLWEMYSDKARRDPGMYLYWLGLDDEDDIEKRADWEKIMVASWVTWESIEDQRGMAASARQFERYTANRFPKDNDAYSVFKAPQLDRCERGTNRFDFTKPWTLGIDGATAGDSFAIVAYQKRKTKKGKTVCLTKEWVFDTPDEETGHYDFEQITQLIAGLCSEHWPQVVGIDPNRLIVMNSRLRDVYGIETVSFPQNNATMCQATSIVVNEVKAGELRLRGCPKLRAHLANTVEMEREPYGMRFGKDSKKSKIDAAIALAIAALAYDKLVSGTESYVPVS